MVVMSEIGSLAFYMVSFLLASFLLYTGHLGPKKNKTLIVIGLLIPIAIAAFRYRVGSDYGVYLEGFRHTKNVPWSDLFKNVSGTEYGYIVLGKILADIGNVHLYFGTTAAITLVFTYLALSKHYSKVASVGLTYFLYLVLHFVVSFNGMRQMMAVAVIFWAFEFIFEKKPIHYFSAVIFSMFVFHTSSIIALPAYFFWDHENKTIRKIPTIIGVTAVIIFVFAFQSVFETLGQASNTFDRYAGYAETEAVGKNRDLLLKIVILVPLLALYKGLIKADPRNALFLLFLFISMLLGITGFKTPHVKRMGIYFEIVAIVLLPQMTLLYAAREKPIIQFAMFMYGIGLFTLVFYILGQSHVIPYKFMLQ